jgi:hypothetical protein
MTVYADTSFLLQLLVQDFANREAIDCYRSMGRPVMALTSLHRLEIGNALRLRLFAAARMASRERDRARMQSAEAARRLQLWIRRGTLPPANIEMEDVFLEASSLSDSHTEATGTRSLDTLHVAGALLLRAGRFLTCDQRQAVLASRSGLKVRLIGGGN